MQHHSLAGRAGEAGEPGEAFGLRRYVIAAKLTAARHQETVKAMLREPAAQGGEPPSRVRRDRGRQVAGHRRLYGAQRVAQSD